MRQLRSPMTDAPAGLSPDGERPIVNVVGERVALGPFERQMLPALQHRLNDFQVVRT